ncbi:MAG: ribonuclease P protein component [Roseitalea porphyridii]|uniref:ribonuclease P protein component n=3 Tax=Roseitalea porphyridii TaxID=1852022 RepID=UPI0032D95736
MSSGTRPYAMMRKRAEFLAARDGTRINGRTVRLEMRRRDPGEAGETPRVGFTVTRKIGGAVVRNRAKRRLREAVRLAAARDMRPLHDYVIISKPDVLTAPFSALCEDLRQVIARAHGRAARTGPEQTPGHRGQPSPKRSHG